MKFRDIPQFTRSSPYSVNVGLKYLKGTIDEYCHDSGLQLNPDFQRGHVWTESQQIAFVEFLLKGGKTGRDIYLNHTKGISGGHDGEMVCVDGLQRITAILRFVNNEIPIFGVLHDCFEDKLNPSHNIIIHINDLKTKAEVLTWYLEMNSGGTPHTEDELDRVRDLLDSEQDS